MMARKLRLEAEGGIYHVINRGNYRQHIFADEGAKGAFLTCLGEACAKTGWVIHAWCVMGNHFHLAIETPEPNLIDGMRWLQSTFASRFNRFRKANGHLFQGRYKSLIVDPDEGLGPLCHYIHLNPVRARLCEVEALSDWPWTSLRWMVKPRQRASWFSPAAALSHAGALPDTPNGRNLYVQYLGWLAEDQPAQKSLRFEAMSRGWVIGSREFQKELMKEHKMAEARIELGDRESDEIRGVILRERLSALLARLGKTEADLGAEAKSAPWKIAIAAVMKTTTVATNAWLAQHLQMGSMYQVSRMVSSWLSKPDKKLVKKLGASAKRKA